MNEKDKRWAETIIDYCNRIDDYLNRIDDDKEIYMSDSLYINAFASFPAADMDDFSKNSFLGNGNLVKVQSINQYY